MTNTITELAPEAVLVGTTRAADPEKQDCNLFMSRGEFVLHFSSYGKSSPKDLATLWKAVSDHIPATFVELDSTIRLWNVGTGMKCLRGRIIDGKRFAIRSVAFSNRLLQER